MQFSEKRFETETIFVRENVRLILHVNTPFQKSSTITKNNFCLSLFKRQ